MDFRSSNSVAALALLIASGGCALFAPVSRAGDRLEFSTPAIPLAVPHPDVEIKEPKKLTGSEATGAGIMDGVDMGSPQQQQFISAKPKSRDKYDLDSKDKYDLGSGEKYDLDPRDKHGLSSGDNYDLDSNPLLGEDQDKRGADDWLNTGPAPNRVTNSSSLNMLREWDARNSDGFLQRRNEAGGQAGQNASRFGAQTGYDRDNAWDGDRNTRDGTRYGRETSNDKEVSFWSKTLDHDSSRTDRFSATRFPTLKDEPGNYGFGALEPRKTEPAPAADSAHTEPAQSMALPSGFGSFTPLDGVQNRQTGELFSQQTGANQGLRAWETPTASRPPSRSTSNPGQNSQSRTVAPNRPVNLPFPKRPDSPY